MRIDSKTSVPKRVLLDGVEFDVMNMISADDTLGEITMIDWSKSSATPGSRIFHAKDLVVDCNGRRDIPKIIHHGMVKFDWSEVRFDRGTVIPGCLPSHINQLFNRKF